MTRPADLLLARAVRRAAVRATFAPSIHNTQPWRLRPSSSNLEIHADWNRRLQVLDPRGRQLLISCGCAVFNSRVALAAAGYDAAVEPFPDPAQPNLIARLTPAPLRADRLAIARLDSVVELRRTNRRHFTNEVIPGEVVDSLIVAAFQEGAELLPITKPEHWLSVARLSEQAEHLEASDMAYRAELRAWTGVDVLRTKTSSIAGACLLLLGTQQDTPAAWVRAGEAMERVLLELTSRGYVASPLTQVIEVATTNAVLRQELQLTMHPHILLRVGRAPETPAARRRRLVDMLEESR